MPEIRSGLLANSVRVRLRILFLLKVIRVCWLKCDWINRFISELRQQAIIGCDFVFIPDGNHARLVDVICVAEGVHVPNLEHGSFLYISVEERIADGDAADFN